MNTELINQLLKASCLALVHSLWQGLIIAVVVAIILQRTKNWMPAFRYHLLGAALLLFL